MAAEFQDFLAQKGRLKRLRDAGEHLPGESEGSGGGAWTEEGEGQWEEEQHDDSGGVEEKHGPFNRPSAMPDFNTYEVNIPQDVLNSLYECP